ncbi:MAG: response regulator [Planctomycetota bacterium]|nr:response regulator [Planctomycetota bacterium]
MARIAVVEDEALIRALIGELLVGRGHELMEFEGCVAAYDALEQDPPDLLVCDVRLPDGSGLDMVARLRATYGDTQLPVLMLSGLKTEADFLRGYAAGATDYLAKPFTPDELLAKCQVLLARTARQGAGVNTGADHLPADDHGLAFGRYQVMSVLGQGSYGVVYSAHDVQADRPVALKVLSALPASQPECRLRFLRETYALSAVRCPHVAAIHDFGTSEGRLYYAMDLVPGPTVERQVRRVGVAREDELVGLLRGLARALEALAAADIVHRDLKPANVILRDGRWDRPVLVDFGLAKRPFDRGLTDAQMLIGTPGYMPPECIRGEAPDARSDLFSLGLVGRYAAMGVEAFPELTGLPLLQAMASRPVSLPRSVSPGLREVLRRLTSVDRRRRTPSASALVAELDALEGQPLPVAS